MTFVEMLVRRRSLLCVADAMTAQSIRNVSLLIAFFYIQLFNCVWGLCMVMVKVAHLLFPDF